MTELDEIRTSNEQRLAALEAQLNPLMMVKARLDIVTDVLVDRLSVDEAQAQSIAEEIDMVWEKNLAANLDEAERQVTLSKLTLPGQESLFP